MSPNPSALTSPADATDEPNQPSRWPDSEVQAASGSRPVAEPRYTYARPSSLEPPSVSSAPTITSSNSSPLTSPAVDTAYPNAARFSGDATVQEAVVSRP